MNGEYLEIDGRPALRFERVLAHPQDKVWNAVTDPGELTHWFPADVDAEMRVGGGVRFTFREGEGPPGDGQVTELDPPQLFEFTWNDDRLRFELEPAGDGTRLVFTHFLDAADRAARDAAGWHVCLDNLERRLAGAEGTDGDWRGLYADYQSTGMPTGAPVPDWA